MNADTVRWLGSISVNYSDQAFWSDVLTSAYHGYTDAYTMLNGAFGWKWAGGKVTTLIKGTNLYERKDPAARLRRHHHAFAGR